MPGFPPGWDADRFQKIARSLHEIAGKQARPGILSRWLHGPKYTDIFVDIAPGGTIVKVEISFGGYFLRWEPSHELMTGVTDEMEVHDGAPASRFIQQHPVADPAILHGARTLVAAFPDTFLAEEILAVLQPPLTTPK